MQAVADGLFKSLRRPEPSGDQRNELRTTPIPHKAEMKGETMQIKLTGVFVDDQEKALKFYTDVLGFAKKMDFSAGSYRWLTVVSAEEPEGVQLVLEPNQGFN